mgnify:CR=1 FL=1
MNTNEPERRCLDGESVPTDWIYVRTVEEGLKQRQAQNIGDRKEPQEQQELRVRHRAMPKEAPAPEAARTVMPTVSGDSPFILPEYAIKPAPEQEEPPQTAPEAKPESPADADPEQAAAGASAAEPAPQRRRVGSRAAKTVRHAEPTDKEVPEWYRVAMQNLTPEDIRYAPARRQEQLQQPEPQPQKPTRGAAPKERQKPVRQADVYAAAGYPPELLEEQRRLDALSEAEQMRKRHGAMSVLKDEPKPEAAAGNRSFPPPRSALPQRRTLSPAEQAARMRAVERYTGGAALHPDSGAPSPYTVTADELSPEDEARPRFPWLGVVTSLVLLLAVFLWLNRITVGKELEKVYVAREQAARQVVNEHPYEYRELIEMQAANYNLHPAFVASIVLNESSFRPGVKSSADAMGLMQIRPDTGNYINRALDIPDYNHQLLYEPETNILFGCYYLGELSERFMGDPVLVAAAYNAGPNNVQNWLNNSSYSADKRTIPLDNIPFGDTQTYARRVLRDFAAYKRLYYETPEGE